MTESMRRFHRKSCKGLFCARGGFGGSGFRSSAASGGAVAVVANRLPSADLSVRCCGTAESAKMLMAQS